MDLNENQEQQEKNGNKDSIDDVIIVVKTAEPHVRTVRYRMARSRLSGICVGLRKINFKKPHERLKISEGNFKNRKEVSRDAKQEKYGRRKHWKKR